MGLSVAIAAWVTEVMLSPWFEKTLVLAAIGLFGIALAVIGLRASWLRPRVQAGCRVEGVGWQSRDMFRYRVQLLFASLLGINESWVSGSTKTGVSGGVSLRVVRLAAAPFGGVGSHRGEGLVFA
jgi:hypothetical protein